MSAEEPVQAEKDVSQYTEKRNLEAPSKPEIVLTEQITLSPGSSTSGSLQVDSNNTTNTFSTVIRILTANLTSGNNQSYSDPGKRILQGLKPDIVLIQEFSIYVDSKNVAGQSPETTDLWVSEVFGPEYFWYREPGDEQIPNGIISRWPFSSYGEINNRSVRNRDTVYAQIDIPGEIDLWVFCVHFITGPESAQFIHAEEIISFIQQNVPEEDFLVVGGTFNGNATLALFQTIVETSPPYPSDDEGNNNTNGNRNNIYSYILANNVFDQLQIPIIYGTTSYLHGLVYDSRRFLHTELSPIRSGDSEAQGMQHMAVLKDFKITFDLDDVYTTERIGWGIRSARYRTPVFNLLLIVAAFHIILISWNFFRNYSETI